MIQNYAAKKKAGNVSLESTPDGNVRLLEKKFDEITGAPYVEAVQVTNVKHIQDVLADLKASLEPTLALIIDLETLLPDVESKQMEIGKAGKTVTEKKVRKRKTI